MCMHVCDHHFDTKRTTFCMQHRMLRPKLLINTQVISMQNLNLATKNTVLENILLSSLLYELKFIHQEFQYVFE